MEEESYTTGQAARILKVTDRGVRKMIDRGELEASQDERGRHLIPQRHAVYNRLVLLALAENALASSEWMRRRRGYWANPPRGGVGVTARPSGSATISPFAPTTSCSRSDEMRC